MSDFVRTKHDIGFLRTDGTTEVGLRLAKDKNGNPIYRTFDDEYLAQQIFSGTPDYNNLPPEKEIAIRQDDWRAGFGQEVYDATDPRRYYSSIGMDMRFKGMAIAGPIATGIALLGATSASLANTDFEATGSWTGGSRNAAAPAVRSGSYGWEVAVGSNAYQDATTWATTWQGRRFTFSCWVKASDASGGRLQINDGVGTTSSSYHTGGGAWEQLTVTRTLDIAATRLRITLDNQGAVNVVYFDDAALTNAVAGGIITAMAEFNDKLYVAMGTILAKLNATGNGWTAVYQFANATTDLETFTDNKLYITLGTTNAYWEMNTSEAFTENTLAVKTFQFFQRVDAASPTMWGNDGNRTIRSNTNPANGGGAWSAQTNVDTSYYDITGFITMSGALYIMKEDMPYYLNSAGAVQNDLAPDLKSATASTSGKNAFLWKNKIYIPFGTQGLLETDGTTNTFINPSIYCTNLTAFVGRVMAVTGDEEWLYVAVDNSTKVEILAGRQETIDSVARWIWHPICELTLTNVECMHVSSVYQKRLWIASTSASDNVFYIPLPLNYGDITNDTNRNFLTSTEMITPWLHGNFRGDTKAFIKIVAELGHTYDVDIYFECWYKKFEDTSWTDAGDLKGTATNRIATLYFPADAASLNPKSTRFQLKFVAKTDDTTKTPILSGYDVRAILYPANRRIIECEVIAEDEIVLKDSTIERGQGATIKTSIEEARNATWPVTFYPLGWTGSSDTIYVKFLPTQMSITKDEKGRGVERHYLLRLQEVALS